VRPDELAGLSNLETSAVMAAALADVFGVKRDAPRGDPKCETCAGCGYHLPHPGMREACPDCVKREGA
jgi:hypothetical protein